MEQMHLRWNPLMDAMPIAHGSRFWTRFEELASIIVTLAISVLAYTIAPMAFAIGLAGALACRLFVPLIIGVLKHSPTVRNSSMYSLAGHLLEGSFITGTLLTAHQLTAVKFVALPTILCTLSGYYLPLSAYHEIKGMLK